ncbi:GyrI-like domain-containing protein [Nocardioides bruguierae]|uniref:GyrI-like domain-containing protein n=1 Tax=Nocardioides bruguierae TaxID=2945102 RepID=A0A9X2D516_9ACTN|nr:GyrI-like domain-containing protein [Nocardioides bruguierae]MCM0619276.1 GyrI-like domain-containing protein [Nocardioides bruguierae]
MKVDPKSIRADLYRPRAGHWAEVDVPPLRYLAVDGHGDPNTAPVYAVAVGALYTLAYATKLGLREATGIDAVVAPLEGLWTSADPTAFTGRRKDEWDWTMLIALPDPALMGPALIGPALVGTAVTDTDVDAALDRARTTAATRRPDVPTGDVRVLTLDEGRCLQTLHVGPYDEEGPTLALLHDEVMPEAGLTWNGPHHEVYLGDPRRTAPERLRTVLRQPVRAATGQAEHPSPRIGS